MNARLARLLARIVAWTLVFFLLSGWLPLSRWMYAQWEGVYSTPCQPWPQAMGLIVLGGGHEIDVPDRWEITQMPNRSHQRLSASREMALRHPGWTVVFSGGPSKHARQDSDERTEAEGGLAYWRTKGMPGVQTLLEMRSNNTAENARFTSHMLGEKRHQLWLLYTSGFHMARARAAFEHEGVHVQACPVDLRAQEPAFWRDWNSQYHLRASWGVYRLLLRECLGWLWTRCEDLMPLPWA